jgi:hypothetical protein
MRTFSGALLALILACSTAQAADLAGTWSGTWTKGGDALPVVVSFEKGANGYSGHFDSDALQVAGIPFADVNETGEGVHFVLKGDQSTDVFDGRQRGDAIDGTFTETSTKGTFHLARANAAPQAVESRDVDFTNGDVKLAGTLLLPSGKERHPAILFLHGSGPEGRWANRWLAQKFAESGFVALITDKRGVGQSTGDWKAAGFDDLAGDAVAGIRLLQSLPEVDARKVGIYGHSQGGTIAPLVGVRAANLGFVIAAAAGGIDPAKMEEYSVGNSIGISSLPPKEAADASAFVHAIVDVAYRGAPRAELDAPAAKFKNRPWYFDPPPADDFYWAFSRRIAGYDPERYWRQVKAPVLLLFGDRDERVPPKDDADAITAALRAGRDANVTVKMFPNADHTFSLPVAHGGWPKHVGGYADVMIGWAKAQTR